MWFNYQCDPECNTTECAYDFGQCIDIITEVIGVNDTCYIYPGPNITHTMMEFDVGSLNESNYSYNYTLEYGYDHQRACYTSWIGDSWCDLSCVYESCEFDNGDCDGCTQHCQELYKYAITLLASASVNEPADELITVDELCSAWSLAQTLKHEIGINVTNCTSMFNQIDINNNGYMGMYETLLIVSPVFGLDETDPHYQEKIRQIDCSGCLANASLYYW